MKLLPTWIGQLANHADRKDSTRFALNGVRIEIEGERFTAAATDSKQLFYVEGDCIDPQTNEEERHRYPVDSIPRLNEAPNGATSCLVPWDKLKDVCKRTDKLTKKEARSKPVLSALPIVMSERVTTFGATNGTDSLCEQIANIGILKNVQKGAEVVEEWIPGRFPPFKDIIPRKKPSFRMAIDPRILANVLATCAEFTDDESLRVEMEFHVDPDDNETVNKPVAIRVPRSDGTKVVAVVMPLAWSK